MGAVCGRPTKKRDPSKPYVDFKTDENNTQTKENNNLVSDPGTQPAIFLDNDPMSPSRHTSVMNRGAKDLFAGNEKRATDENFKDSFFGQLPEKNMGIPQQESLQRITFKFGETLTNLDQSQKNQIKSMNNYPLDNPRSLTFAASNVPFQNYMSYANVDKSESVLKNLFEPMYKDKPRICEDYYLDMDEKALRKYYQFFNSLNQNKSKSLSGQLPSSRLQSQLSEWSKVLQKHFSQEKTSTSLNDNKHKLNKVYKTILAFEERNWYEEMVMLYKEKQAMSKVNGNMTSLPFDRKLVQLQEQFKWLISTIANTRLNPSSIVRVHDFPPYRLPSRKKGDKLDTSVFSMVRGHNSVTGSEDVSDVLSPLRPAVSIPGQSNAAPTQIGGLFNFDSPPDPRQNYYSDFPDIYSSAWQDGFLWKGVYLKLYAKTEAQQLKKELKVLKHMGVEYLQTETSIKINDPASGENVDGKNTSGGQTWNVLLPIICTVESSSWVLLGTPMFSVRMGLLEDNLSRISAEASNVFKNTFLLSSVSSKNFKIYNKVDDGQGGPSLLTMSSFGQSSYLANAQSSQNNNMFVLLSNVGRNMAALPRVNVMMIISQEINTNISFVEYPTRGLDPEIIKKALGYFDEKIGFDMLMETKRTKLDLTDRDNKQEQDLTFEVLQFKRKGWLMQMIHVTSKKDLPPTFAVNKRAMDLLSLSGTKKTIQIKGNVLVFGCLPNTDTIVHPYFITEQTFSSAFEEERPIWRESSDPTSIRKFMQDKEKPGIYLNSALQLNSRNPSQAGGVGMSSLIGGRESIARGGNVKTVKDERILHEYFLSNASKSVDSIVEHLENTDAIYNFASLKELFHRKGLNMRFEWIVYAKLKRERAKVLVGADILARCIKMILNELTSKRLKYFGKQATMRQLDPMAQKKKMEEIKQEKTQFLLEDFYKKALCQYVNVLIKDNSNTSEYEYHETLFQDLSTDLFLHRMRVLEVARRCLDPQHFEHFLSADITKTIINIPCLDANVFLDAISYHSSLCINYEVIRQIRNDKYVHWVSGQGLVIKPVDLNIIYSESYYLTTHERCYLLLLKFLPTMNLPNQNSIEFHLPPSLYKLRKGTDMHTSTYDCFLREYYELPDLEILNDWVVLLESVMNGLYTSDGQQNLLVEAYIVQMVLAFFNEEDNDNQMTSSILERINTFANNSPVTSPELAIAIHTWYGIIAESKLFVECEQSYTIALLVLHKLYGDPRGRGGTGSPWELFITWRLSILCRLQGKLHDAEYSEELFDAALISMKENPLNQHVKSHYIYNNPLKAFQHPVHGVKQQNEPSHITTKPNLKGLQQGEHPFPYWINNLAFDETCAKIDTLNSTLQKTPQLLKWMITYMPIFQPSGVLWDTAYLKDFFMSIMQSSFSNITLVSSVSNNSLERGRDKSTVGLDLSTTQKGLGRSSDKRENKFNPSGNMVQIFEKDGSTFNKREINGTLYSWGQNDKGQVGTTICGLEDFGLPRMKKMKMYYPKRIITLKDTIIQSVSCGHSHSMAITLDGQLLAWGDNRYSQLGLGPKAPSEVFIPTMVSNLKDVISVSCGHEHTVALTKTGLVYSWGEGEEGLLGHGDTRMQNIPKRVEALKDIEIQAVVCGGLHTLVLTKQGAVYAWGKGEGGQLGIPIDQLTRNPADGHVYLTVPKKIRSSLEGTVVVQIACGDAHSLALTQKGIVYAWGYTYQGQLGLGITRDTLDPSISCQVPEPTPIEKLTSVKVTEVYAGATFSLFLSDKKELYGCGLNESNQLGIERNVKKVSSHLDQMGPISAAKAMESAFPKKLDCFTSMPVLKAACGEAHSLALVLCDSSFMLFSWGMQKQGQLGIGDIQMPNSTPRPIPFLQYAMPYSMGCGAYHSLVVIGEPSKAFRKESLTERLEKKSENRWNSVFFEMKGSYESMIEMALNNLDNIIPNEEGKIDNMKVIRKTPAQS